MNRFVNKLISKSLSSGERCMVCLIGLTLNSTCFIIPIRGHCRHQNAKYFNRKSFKLEKRWWISSFAVIACLFISFIKYILDIKKILSTGDSKLAGLLAVEECIFVCAFMLVAIIAILRSKERVSFLNSLEIMLKNKYYKEIIDASWKWAAVRKWFYLRLFLGLMFVVTDSFLVIFFKEDGSLYKNFSLILSTYTLISLNVQGCNELAIIVKFRICIDMRLLEHLNMRRNGGNSYNIQLKEHLKRIGRFYVDFHNCVTNRLNSFLGPIMVVWNLATIIMLVFDIYMKTLIVQDTSEKKNIFNQLRTLVHLVGIYALVASGEKVTCVSDSTLSFLFKYPISKLSEIEAHQVEMLIYTLSTHKPEIKASDIFTVGNRLLPSISGAVVTYVLVALQFRPAWLN
ncbi:hypothetical protein WA026_013210 [Henosepilachna vigintioctopunctata]|uniref:Gustatory receptor n=1 Tax=Henosepilachna vigintioctopunctata TaxID=420089 RepID=A0AAW1UK20_9CUCU